MPPPPSTVPIDSACSPRTNQASPRLKPGSLNGRLDNLSKSLCVTGGNDYSSRNNHSLGPPALSGKLKVILKLFDFAS